MKKTNSTFKMPKTFALMLVGMTKSERIKWKSVFIDAAATEQKYKNTRQKSEDKGE